MKFLTLPQILELHRLAIEQSGGGAGLRDWGALESAAAQPLMTFDGVSLYLTLADKAAALGFSLMQNHPFVDGNKRVGHAALEVTLVLNGYELAAPADEQEHTVLALASGLLSREELAAWVAANLKNL
jgi:death-on-curing protein